MSAETEYNVVVRLSVVRPEEEYLPELLRRRLNGWDAYTGHIRVRSVSVLWGHSPLPEGTAAEALATLDAPSVADSAWIAVTPETMPTKGTVVLVWSKRILGGGHIFAALWNGLYWQSVPGGWSCSPTHYMPLPAPPVLA